MKKSAFLTLDETFEQALLEAFPELATMSAGALASHFSTKSFETAAFFAKWDVQRNALNFNEVAPAELGALQRQNQCVRHWAELHQTLATHKIDLRDPDGLTERLLLIDAQATDPTLEREERLAASAQLLESLGPFLAHHRERVEPAHLDPALLRRARQMTSLHADVLSALCEDADPCHEINQKSAAAKALVAATRDAEISLQKHEAFLEKISLDDGEGLANAEHRPIGKDAYCAMLHARGLASLDACKAELYAGVADLLAEEVRLRHRGFAAKSTAELLKSPLSEQPQSMDEALAWAEELVDLSHTFALESQLFPMSNHEQILVGEGYAHQDLLAESALLRLPKKGAETQISRLLLTPLFAREKNTESEPAQLDFSNLHLAGLEAMASRALSPGAHLFAVWANHANVALQSGALAGVNPLWTLLGEEAQLGWQLHAEELMRELQFRDSPAIRWETLHQALAAAAHGIADLGLHAQGWSTQQAMHWLMTTGRLSMIEARNRVWASLRRPTHGLSAYIGRNQIHDLRRRARVSWRSEFSERRLNETVLFHGKMPLHLLIDAVEAKPTFSFDERTAEYDLNDFPKAE